MNNPSHKTAPLNTLGVAEIVEGIRLGIFRAEDVARSCLARIAERDGAVGAWVAVDEPAVLVAARASPRNRDLPLVGVPFGVKDVLDTSDLPTEMGSRLYGAHAPRYDAGIVAQARMAGAILLGKTTTCEFAGTQPTVTANPVDLSRGPGGSSSGSAAAVADEMVPFAFGTQTGGSILRPAAFCGVVGFKPSYGLYTIAGMKPAAHSFDTIGLIARSVADIALLHSVFMNTHCTVPRDVLPRIGLLRSHLWNTVEPAVADILECSAARLSNAGAFVVEVSTPREFSTITDERAIINAYERARGLAGEWNADRTGMGSKTVAVCERGFAISGSDYVAARRAVDRFRTKAAQLFDDVDLLMLPSAPTEAPAGKDDTGDPRLQELWTMLHLPSLTLPAGRGRNGMPIGIQLVAPALEDERLLAWAEWIGGALAVHDSTPTSHRAEE